MMPTPSGFAQDQHVAGSRAVVALDAVRMNQSERDKPVDRLRRIDGMAAGDRNAGGGADGLPARDDALNRLDRDFADRHAEQRERHDRLAAHRIHVGDRVGRGDASEIERIVDDRHEEVGRRDERLRIVQAIDGRVVARLGADEQIRKGARERRLRQNFAQQRWRELAASAAAVRKLRQADCTWVNRTIHLLT